MTKAKAKAKRQPVPRLAAGRPPPPPPATYDASLVEIGHVFDTSRSNCGLILQSAMAKAKALLLQRGIKDST